MVSHVATTQKTKMCEGLLKIFIIDTPIKDQVRFSIKITTTTIEDSQIIKIGTDHKQAGGSRVVM